MVQKSFMKVEITRGDIDDDVAQLSITSNLDCFFDNNANDADDFMDTEERCHITF